MLQCGTSTTAHAGVAWAVAPFRQSAVQVVVTPVPEPLAWKPNSVD
jgi:hypothetical protein